MNTKKQGMTPCFFVFGSGKIGLKLAEDAGFFQE
jgi:hypothetical protein